MTISILFITGIPPTETQALRWRGEAYWPSGAVALEGAEQAMLALSCRRAGLEDGMEVLELGCGRCSPTLTGA